MGTESCLCWLYFVNRIYDIQNVICKVRILYKGLPKEWMHAHNAVSLGNEKNEDLDTCSPLNYIHLRHAYKIFN